MLLVQEMLNVFTLLRGAASRGNTPTDRCKRLRRSGERGGSMGGRILLKQRQWRSCCCRRATAINLFVCAGYDEDESDELVVSETSLFFSLVVSVSVVPVSFWLSAALLVLLSVALLLRLSLIYHPAPLNTIPTG